MKIVKYIIRVVSAIGITLMLCILSIKTMGFMSDAEVDGSDYRICAGFIMVGTLYLCWLIWWYIGLGKEGYEEYKSKRIR